jgi:hypothetical protein
MNNLIDIDFDFYSDTPLGKDPDSYSPTLRRYHIHLWSKLLPQGRYFNLTDKFPKVLHHQSELGEFFLSSDSIGHSYSKVKSMSHIIGQVSSDEIRSFFETCSTIGGYIVFPSKRIDNKMTINGARGLNQKIKDRFDLTLECIRRHYASEDSPLGDTLRRYKAFFDLFGSFQGYVDFFLLQDLVAENQTSIEFFLPFNNFDGSPLPNNVNEYRLYKENVTDFVSARN